MTAKVDSGIISNIKRKSRSPILRYEIGFVVIAAIAIAIYFQLSGDTQGFAYDFFGLAAPAGIIAGIWLNRPAQPLPWILFAIGFFIFISGDIISRNYVTFFGHEPPLPSISDGLFLTGNIINFVAVFLLLRSREPFKDTGSLIDALIVGTTGAAFAWIFIMDRYANEENNTVFQRLVKLNTPIVDLIVLVLTTRLIFGTGLRTTSFYLILGGFISSMVADILYSGRLYETYSPGDLVDIGWILFFLAFCAAGLHPSMARVAEPGTHEPMRLSTQRLLLLTGAVLLVPVVTIMQWQRGESTDTLVFAGASGIAFVLVVLR
ncbi:MAG: hypothetical protein ACRDHN_03300, partial [Thermomicrobiales bacterium]